MTIRSFFCSVTLLVSLLLLGACSGVRVTTDYDVSREFGALKTYAWMEPKQKLVVDPLVDNDLMNRRIQRSVEKAMAANGFQKAQGEDSVDFLVAYHVSAEDKISVDSFHAGYGYYPCWGCYGFHGHGRHDVTVRQYKQGTFMLDVVDPAKKELIWRGVAGQRLSKGTPQERDAYVQEIVTAILANFPPGRNPEQ